MTQATSNVWKMVMLAMAMIPFNPVLAQRGCPSPMKELMAASPSHFEGWPGETLPWSASPYPEPEAHELEWELRSPPKLLRVDWKGAVCVAFEGLELSCTWRFAESESAFAWEDALRTSIRGCLGDRADDRVVDKTWEWTRTMDMGLSSVNIKDEGWVVTWGFSFAAERLDEGPH